MAPNTDEEGGFSRYNPAILLISWLEKLGYMRSDGIIGTMPNLAEHVKKLQVTVWQFLVFPWG